jgi:hypothetical protein
MPRVKGFLRIIGRRGHRPGQGLPPEEEDMTPGWGVEEGEPPQVEPPDIDPPPGVWPGPSPGHPIHPVPPAGEGPGHLPEIPPGSIWPRPPGPVSGHFIVLAHIPQYGWRYIVIDPDGWPEPPAGGIGGVPPQRPGPGEPRR